MASIKNRRDDNVRAIVVIGKQRVFVVSHWPKICGCRSSSTINGKCVTIVTASKGV